MSSAFSSSVIMLGGAFGAIYALDHLFKCLRRDRQRTYGKLFDAEWLRTCSMEAFARETLVVYPDLKWLADPNVDVSPESRDAATSKSPSESVYGQKYGEFDRAICSLYCMLLVLITYDYKTFIQPQKVQPMTRESWEKLTTYSYRAWKSVSAQLFGRDDQRTLYNLGAYVVLNDLGKSQTFARRVAPDQPELDHDQVLLKALEKGDIIEFDDEVGLEAMKQGMALDFNPGQFMQGENLPANLFKLARAIKHNSPAVEMFMFHYLYDLAGVVGQVTAKGSIVMNDPTTRVFFLMMTELNAFTKTDDLVGVYTNYLTARMKFINPPADVPTDFVWLNRVVAMCRFNDYYKDFAILNFVEQYGLGKNDANAYLNLLEPTKDKNTYLLYYAPAMFQNGLKNGWDVYDCLVLLGEVYKAVDGLPNLNMERPGEPKYPVSVNIASVADWTKKKGPRERFVIKVDKINYRVSVEEESVQ